MDSRLLGSTRQASNGESIDFGRRSAPYRFLTVGCESGSRLYFHFRLTDFRDGVEFAQSLGPVNHPDSPEMNHL